MLALCWATWPCGGAWEPRLVKKYIEFDKPTWPNLSSSWANLSPTWANLSLLDAIPHGFSKPSWYPKSNQNHSKTNPNSKPGCIMVSMPCLIDSGSISNPILEGFGCHVESQVDQQIYHLAFCWQMAEFTKSIPYM